MCVPPHKQKRDARTAVAGQAARIAGSIRAVASAAMATKRTRCRWQDPVECTAEFSSASLYRLHEQVLDHLNAVHDHAGDSGFYVQWEDPISGWQTLGEAP